MVEEGDLKEQKIVEVDSVLDKLQEEEETIITHCHSTCPKFYCRSGAARSPWVHPSSWRGLSFPTHKNDLFTSKDLHSQERPIEGISYLVFFPLDLNDSF